MHLPQISSQGLLFRLGKQPSIGTGAIRFRRCHVTVRCFELIVVWAVLDGLSRAENWRSGVRALCHLLEVHN